MEANLGRGELVRWLYRLGRQSASGILTLTPAGTRRGEVFVLRRGAVVVADGERIIWVCGMRLDERFRIEEGTEQALRMEIVPASEFGQ